MNKFHCRAFSLFETVTRGSQIKTLAIEPNCWDRSTNIKHQIPSRSLKECFSGNPGKIPHCRAFIHSRFNLCTQLKYARSSYRCENSLLFSSRLVFYYDYFILSSVCILPLVCSLQSAVCILPSVCILPPVCSLQSAVCVLH